MPARKPQTPAHYQPTLQELLAYVRQRGGASLRQVAAAVWPDLPWTGAAGCDSAQRLRRWPGGGEASPAQHLADLLQELVLQGALRHGPRRRDEVDALASVAYVPVLASDSASTQPIPQDLLQALVASCADPEAVAHAA